MKRFFEIVETDADTFIKTIGTDYNDKRVIVPIDGTVFVVINDKKSTNSVYLSHVLMMKYS